MTPHRTFRVIQILAMAALAWGLYWTCGYQTVRLLFRVLDETHSNPPSHPFWMALILVAIMAWVVRLPLRFAALFFRNGWVGTADFEAWRVQMEKTRWTVLGILIALPAIPLVLRDEWTGYPLLLVLPVILLQHLRIFLSLPAPTDPRNRLDVDQPLR